MRTARRRLWREAAQVALGVALMLALAALVERQAAREPGGEADAVAWHGALQLHAAARRAWALGELGESGEPGESGELGEALGEALGVGGAARPGDSIAAGAAQRAREEEEEEEERLVERLTDAPDHVIARAKLPAAAAEDASELLEAAELLEAMQMIDHVPARFEPLEQAEAEAEDDQAPAAQEDPEDVQLWDDLAVDAEEDDADDDQQQMDQQQQDEAGPQHEEGQQQSPPQQPRQQQQQQQQLGKRRKAKLVGERVTRKRLAQAGLAGSKFVNVYMVRPVLGGAQIRSGPIPRADNFVRDVAPGEVLAGIELVHNDTAGQALRIAPDEWLWIVQPWKFHQQFKATRVQLLSWDRALNHRAREPLQTCKRETPAYKQCVLVNKVRAACNVLLRAFHLDHDDTSTPAASPTTPESPAMTLMPLVPATNRTAKTNSTTAPPSKLPTRATTLATAPTPPTATDGQQRIANLVDAIFATAAV
jgi:hypothetical protein